MIGLRPKETPAAPLTAADTCKDLERQIEEATRRIAEAREAMPGSKSPDQHAKIKGEMEFSEFQRVKLIDERVSLEPARLEEVMAEAQLAFEHGNTLPGLGVKLRSLQSEILQVEQAIKEAEFTTRRLEQAKNDARKTLLTLTSDRAFDQPARHEIERELRERLETLGK
jgi:hypothetical protein